MPSPVRPRQWPLALLLALALTAALTFPTIVQFASGGRFDSGDGMFSIWNVAWIDHALLTQPLHLLDANIFYPHTGTLAYSELNLVAGLLGLPFYLVTGGSAIAALNGALMAGLVLTFMLTWVLVRRLTESSGAGLVAATAFTFCPYVQVHTAHIQLLMTFVFPLLFLAMHAFRDQPSTGRAVGLGAALGLAGLACGYYGIYGGVALGVAALCLSDRSAAYWRGLVVAAVAAGLIVLPVFVPFLHARALVGGGPSYGPSASTEYSATLATYLSSPAHSHQTFLDGAAESVFPGALTLLLAVIGCGLGLVVRDSSEARTARQRRIVVMYLVVAAVAVWASFGPAGHLYEWLARVLPPMSLLRAPVRFGVIATFALCVLGGFALKSVLHNRPAVTLALVLLVAAELSAAPWPLRAAPPVPEAYRLLATLPKAPTVEFHFTYRPSDFYRHTRFMFGSTYHWQPLVNGYSDVIPADFEALATPINAFPDRESFALMKRLGVKYVVWHLEDYNAESRATLVERFPAFSPFLKKLTDADGVWLYEIVGFPDGV